MRALRAASEAQRRKLAVGLLRGLPREVRRKVVLKLLLADGVHRVDVERDGLWWTIDIRDEIGQEVFVSGSYQADMIEDTLAWLRRKRRTGKIVDVGANMGTTTLKFCRAGYHVVAIEPVPETFGMLAENVERNGYKQSVTLLERAISAEAGPVEMWTSTGTAVNEVRVGSHEPGFLEWGSRIEGIIKVDAAGLQRTLTDVAIEPSDVALVWSDAQGAEPHVVATGAALWESGVPLFIEVWPAGIDLHGGRASFLAELHRHFSSFIARDDIASGAERPIREFSEFVEDSLKADFYTDSLLIP
jgi:FkbM family methyltransferase